MNASQFYLPLYLHTHTHISFSLGKLKFKSSLDTWNQPVLSMNCVFNVRHNTTVNIQQIILALKRTHIPSSHCQTSLGTEYRQAFHNEVQQVWNILLDES